MVSHARILQVNVSRGGVPKLPVARGKVTPLGLEGDSHAHPRIHGGPQRALLIVTSEGIEELKIAGYPLFAGALGENLTTEGLKRTQIRIGQRYRVGEVVLEIQSVRQPCETLDIYGNDIQKAVKAGSAASERWGLSGFYCSVLTPGTVRPGDPIVLLDQSA